MLQSFGALRFVLAGLIQSLSSLSYCPIDYRLISLSAVPFPMYGSWTGFAGSCSRLGESTPVLPTPPVAPPSSSHPSLTQPPSVPPPLPSASAAPPIQPYRSLRTAPSSLPTQLPPLPQLSSKTSSAPLNSAVNQARLAHAASSLPRPPARSRRRACINATALPGLPRVPDIASCMTTASGTSDIRTMNIIYPPQARTWLGERPISHEVSMGHILPNYAVLWTGCSPDLTHYTLRSQDTSKISFTNFVLGTSTWAYRWTLCFWPMKISLSFLSMSSAEEFIRLRRAPVRPSATLGELATNRLQFAVPGLCMFPENGQNYLVLHFVMRQPNLTAFLSLPGQVARHHRCLSQRIYTMFPRDRVHESWPHADGDSSCGESDDGMGLDAGDDSDSEFENLPPTPTPGLASTRVLRSTTDIQSRSRVPLPSPTALGAISLPSVLWNESWQPTIRGSTRPEAATSGTPINTIVYRGESASEAAGELPRAVGLYAPGTRQVISSGEGILREVYHIALQKTMATGRQWLTPRSDGKLSLLCLRSSGFGPHTSGPRQRMIGIAGAIGLAVDPVDIALLQFLFNGCDLNSLHPTFMAQWHPAVKAVCDAWKQAGPAGSVDTPLIASHLVTYVGIEIVSVESRDQEAHDGLLVEMFYKSIIASEGPSHAGVVALAKNFRLPCRNGFTFTRYIQGFVGGSERPNETLSLPITAAMGGDSLADILSDYFMGPGIPCPALFEEAK
ncbi:hypothetical protein B0H13DRAFT_1874415 [Mycena leptocephala]|nr:hypothetical protein B0H13DRAFT_1874415 [Mycena leptocephala]